ncbi:hypothetical protein BSKO_09117 [Bryopsis sp. KO-2023]|nr:hypothetical protein BSKO_09117 [Bryopsis sp. KO-2023]
MNTLTFKASVSSASALSANRGQRCVQPSRAALVVEDTVKIRFSRFGRKKRPFYRIVAVDSRKPRETKPLEYLGWHDPINDETNLRAPAIKKWLGYGAQPTDTVAGLLRKALVLED